MALVFCLGHDGAQAADFYRDQNGATAGTGGTGNWSSSNTWRSGSDTGTLEIWANSAINRQLYAGKVKAITKLGQTQIPQSEVEKLLNGAERYRGAPAYSSCCPAWVRWCCGAAGQCACLALLAQADADCSARAVSFLAIERQT